MRKDDRNNSETSGELRKDSVCLLLAFPNTALGNEGRFLGERSSSRTTVNVISAHEALEETSDHKFFRVKVGFNGSSSNSDVSTLNMCVINLIVICITELVSSHHKTENILNWFSEHSSNVSFSQKNNFSAPFYSASRDRVFQILGKLSSVAKYARSAADIS